MTGRAVMLALAGAALCGCATQPSTDAPAGTPPPVVTEDATRYSPSPATPSLDALEQRHRARAHAHARDNNWADALVEWEVLALLRPDAAEYRDALAETRARIKSLSAAHIRAAELARKQDNLEQATVLYLRALNVDRDNSVAAQALRDIDAERTKRAYSNRPPRMRM